MKRDLEKDCCKERAQVGFSTWNEVETAAKDRATWKK